MLDEHIDILALETVEFTIHQAQVAPIAVATNSPERSEGCQFLGHLHTADVASMPYLVAGLEVVQILLVPVAVCVAEYAYRLHLVGFRFTVLLRVDGTFRVQR